VPPPKSKIASTLPGGTGRRWVSVKWRAAAIGSAIRWTGGQPARTAACWSRSFRTVPHAAGQVITAGGR
jgi:hypothetical protein